MSDCSSDDCFVCMDSEGRVCGSGVGCECGFRCWDDALRLRHADLAALRADCHAASWPLASGAFWLRADAAPMCSLEALARRIFSFHTAGLHFDATTSGAEWWANVSTSETICRCVFFVCR